jgi:hypothetical protein
VHRANKKDFTIASMLHAKYKMMNLKFYSLSAINSKAIKKLRRALRLF